MLCSSLGWLFVCWIFCSCFFVQRKENLRPMDSRLAVRFGGPCFLEQRRIFLYRRCGLLSMWRSLSSSFFLLRNWPSHGRSWWGESKGWRRWIHHFCRNYSSRCHGHRPHGWIFPLLWCCCRSCRTGGWSWTLKSKPTKMWVIVPRQWGSQFNPVEEALLNIYTTKAGDEFPEILPC